MAIAAAALTTLLIGACSSSTGGSDQGDASGKRRTLTFETVIQEAGMYSEALQGREVVVINSRAELDAQWARIHGSVDPTPNVPAVDFSRETLVMATAGMKSTGGYEVRIESIGVGSEGAAVSVGITEPGAGCFVTEAFTTPVHVVRTSKISAPLEVAWKTTVRDCD
jgi:hypothetical protein